jgi:uncharacterized membrane protein YkvA (DUF1232 family)
VRVKETLKRWARRAKTELRIVRCIAAHPLTPRSVKILAGALVAYALSPIDLIPDFIPVLGYLDEVVILPLGLYLLFSLTPRGVIEECRREARL